MSVQDFTFGDLEVKTKAERKGQYERAVIQQFIQSIRYTKIIDNLKRGLSLIDAVSYKFGMAESRRTGNQKIAVQFGLSYGENLHYVRIALDSVLSFRSVIRGRKLIDIRHFDDISWLKINFLRNDANFIYERICDDVKEEENAAEERLRQSILNLFDTDAFQDELTSIFIEGWRQKVRTATKSLIDTMPAHVLHRLIDELYVEDVIDE